MAGCPVCGASGSKSWSVVAWRSMGRCVSCGLEWFDRDSYSAAHQTQYLDDASSRSRYYEGGSECDRRTFDARLRQIAAHGGRGRILDIGCSVGTFLEAATAAGWDAVGLEPNPAAAARAKARGFQVHAGFFDRALAERMGPFDVVHLSDVIEHVFDPVGFLSLASRVAAPGGLVVVTTPDFDTVSGRLLQRKPAEHVVHFRRRSLAEAARRARLDVVGVTRVSRDRSIEALQHSTTFGVVGRAVLSLVSRAGAAPLVERMVAPLCRDTLMLVARRPAVAHEACA